MLTPREEKVLRAVYGGTSAERPAPNYDAGMIAGDCNADRVLQIAAKAIRKLLHYHSRSEEAGCQCICPDKGRNAASAALQ